MDDEVREESWGGIATAVGGGVIIAASLLVGGSLRDNQQACDTVLGGLARAQDTGTDATCTAVDLFFDLRPFLIALGVLCLVGGLVKAFVVPLLHESAPPPTDRLRDTLTDLDPIDPDAPPPPGYTPPTRD